MWDIKWQFEHMAGWRLEVHCFLECCWCQLISIHVRQCKDRPAATVVSVSALCRYNMHYYSLYNPGKCCELLQFTGKREERKRRIVLSVSSPLRDSSTQTSVTDWKGAIRQFNTMACILFTFVTVRKTLGKDTWSKEKRKGDSKRRLKCHR